MKTTARIALITLLIGLLATLAYAQAPGPGYGSDPDLAPPRAGVGNANSGNHNMYIHNNQYRYGSLDEVLSCAFGACLWGPGNGDGFDGDGPADGTGFGPGDGICDGDGVCDNDGVCDGTGPRGAGLLRR